MRPINKHKHETHFLLQWDKSIQAWYSFPNTMRSINTSMRLICWSIGQIYTCMRLISYYIGQIYTCMRLISYYCTMDKSKQAWDSFPIAMGQINTYMHETHFLMPCGQLLQASDSFSDAMNKSIHAWDSFSNAMRSIITSIRLIC